MGDPGHGHAAPHGHGHCCSGLSRDPLEAEGGGLDEHLLHALQVREAWLEQATREAEEYEAAADAAEAAAPTRDPPPPGRAKRCWSAGLRVRVHGLVNRLELNGEVGRLLAFDARSDRWGVELAGGAVRVKLRAASLELLEGVPPPVAAVLESPELLRLIGSLLCPCSLAAGGSASPGCAKCLAARAVPARVCRLWRQELQVVRPPAPCVEALEAIVQQLEPGSLDTFICAVRARSPSAMTVATRTQDGGACEEHVHLDFDLVSVADFAALCELGESLVREERAVARALSECGVR